jgi:hypothetical protein
MDEPRGRAVALDRRSDAFSPRRAAGGTAEAIARDQINALHQSLTTAGTPVQVVTNAKEKD